MDLNAVNALRRKCYIFGGGLRLLGAVSQEAQFLHQVADWRAR